MRQAALKSNATAPEGGFYGALRQSAEPRTESQQNAWSAPATPGVRVPTISLPCPRLKQRPPLSQTSHPQDDAGGGGGRGEQRERKKKPRRSHAPREEPEEIELPERGGSIAGGSASMPTSPTVHDSGTPTRRPGVLGRAAGRAGDYLGRVGRIWGGNKPPAA